MTSVWWQSFIATTMLPRLCIWLNLIHSFTFARFSFHFAHKKKDIRISYLIDSGNLFCLFFFFPSSFFSALELYNLSLCIEQSDWHDLLGCVFLFEDSRMHTLFHVSLEVLGKWLMVIDLWNKMLRFIWWPWKTIDFNLFRIQLFEICLW